MARRKDLFVKMSLDYADHPKIAGLSDAAFRAHVEMILYAARYETDGRIPLAFAKRVPAGARAELLNNDPERPSLREVASGGYVLHGYEDHQTTKAQMDELRRKRAESGRLGGIAKASKPLASATPVGTTTASKPATKRVPEEKKSRRVEVSSEPDGFEDFWNTYPRREAKGKARQAYVKALTKTTPDKIRTAAKVYAESRAGEDPKYTALPTSWLNQERWEDEPAPARPSQQSSSSWLDNLETVRVQR